MNMNHTLDESYMQEEDHLETVYQLSAKFRCDENVFLCFFEIIQERNSFRFFLE